MIRLKRHLRCPVAVILGVELVCACLTEPAGAQVLVTNTIPANGANNIARSANVEFFANQALRGTTVTSNRFFAYSPQRGRYAGAITFNSTTNRVTLNPSMNFFAGEPVFADVTTGILNSAGSGNLTPRGWSFYAAAAAVDGTGPLYDSGQRLGVAGVTYLAPVLGDFDGDGDLDAVVATAFATYEFEVYKNTGNGVFTHVQSIDVPYSFAAQGGTSGDFDGDGDLDVIFAVQYGCAILWNDGTGVFAWDSSQPIGTDITRDVAAGDLDGDGDLDLVIACYDYPNAVWTNQGGTFYQAQALNTGHSDGVKLADFNGDGTLDAFIGACDTNSPRLFTNNGHAFFGQAWAAPSSAYWATDVAVGDVTGDGWVDAVCSAGTFDENQVWTNNRAGGFGLRTFSAYGQTGWPIQLGDMDGDGDLDALEGVISQGVRLWRNDGTGGFTNAGQCAGATNAQFIEVGDLDGDGDLDAFAAADKVNLVLFNTRPWLRLLGADGSVMTNGQSASVVQGTDFEDVNMGFTSTRTLSFSNSWQVLVNIANVTTNGTSVFSVENVPGVVVPGSRADFTIRFTPNSLGVHTAAVHIAHDGTNSPTFFYLRGVGTQPIVTNTAPANAAFNQDRAANLSAWFSQPMNGATLTSNRFFVYSAQSGFKRGGITFNSTTNSATLDPTVDLRPGELVHAEITRGVTNHLNNAELVHHTWSYHTAVQTGPALFGDSRQVIGTNDTQGAAMGDLNGDGWLDLFLVNEDQPCEVWTNNRAGIFYRTSQNIGTTNSRYVALGDINRDGDLDAVIVRWGMAAQVLTNAGNGMFYDSGQALSSGNGSHATLADFNGDGALDILLLRRGLPGGVWTNNGSGVFGLYNTTPSAGVGGAGVVDVNGDGFLDAFVANYGSASLVFTNNGSGGLSNTTQSLGFNDSADVAMGDFNGDGSFDAFVANDNGQANTVWFNSGTGTFANSGQALGSGSGRGVAPGDLDGDGDLDAFVVNHGQPNEIWLNDGTGHFADSGRRLGTGDSCRVELGDVDGDGRLDAFVANEHGPCELWLNPRPFIAVLGVNGAVVTNHAAPSAAAGTDFGTLRFGQAATNRLSITNSGIVTLDISGIVVTSAVDRMAFSIVEAPASVSPGAVSNLTVAFYPRGTGTHTATLSITSTATNASPYEVNLSGAATAYFTVTNVTPAGAAALAATNDAATAWLSDAVSAATVTSNRFFAYGAFTGYRHGPIAVGAANRRLDLDPDASFFPGEQVSASLTLGIWNGTGLDELQPHSWSYRMAVHGGSAVFTNSGQVLAHSTNTMAALGDLDGDGDLDVVAGGYNPGSCRVWLNDGHGNLQPAGAFPGLRYAYDVALGDLDGDGDLDAVFGIERFVAPNAIWMNNGDGSFTNNVPTPSSPYPRSVALADLDGDGDLDVFVGSATSGDYVWFNEGGVLVDSGQKLGSDYCNSLRLGDLDGDGDLDAYVVRSFADTVWLNRGNGFFVDSGHVHENGDTYFAALGDVDGDGDLDVCGVGPTNVTLCLNDGSGVFTPSGQAMGGVVRGYGVDFGDLDWDGDLDLFVTPGSLFSNAVLVNDGAGGYSLQPQAMTNGDRFVTLGDLDRDGDLDAYTTFGAKQRDKLWLNVNPGFTLLGINGAAITNGETASLAKGTDFGPVSNATSLAHVFTITNSGPGDLPILAVRTNGADTAHFSCVDMPTRIQAGTVSNFTAVFTPLPSVWGPREAELVIINRGGNDTQMVVRLQGVGVPPLVTNMIPPNASRSVARTANLTAQFSEPLLAATVNSNTYFLHGAQSGVRRGSVTLSPGGGEAVLDPTAAFRPGEWIVGSLIQAITNAPGRAPLRPFAWSFYAATDGGPGSFRDSGQVLGSAPTRSVAFGDLDGDGDLDAFAGNNGQPSRVWFNSGAGVFTQGVQALTSAFTYDVALGDLDLDGDLDVFMANYNQSSRVWLNDGHGVFADSGQALGPYRSQAVVLGDVDGDGDLDAVVGNWAQPAKLWLNDGHGVFTASSQTLAAEMCSDVAIGDLTGDGFLDVFLGTVAGNKVWTNDGFGVFTDSGQTLGSALTYGVALGDADGDGDLDAYAVNSGEPDALWLNDGHGNFADSGQVLSGGFGNQAAFGDINGDGDLDLVIANDWQQPAEVWTNSGSGLLFGGGQVLGSASRYSVALGDVDGDGDVDAFFGNNGSCDVWLNDLTYYRLKTQAGLHGTIAPTGSFLVVGGGSTTIVIRADNYYWTEALTFNGVAVDGAAQARIYTSVWANIYANGTASVTFAEALCPMGTPELWMVRYGLTNGGMSFAAAEVYDWDTDGFDARGEWVADTNPTNNNSYFHISALTNLMSCSALFASSSNRFYSMERTDSLVTGSWTVVAGQTNVHGNGSVMSLTDTNSPDRRLYRVSVDVP